KEDSDEVDDCLQAFPPLPLGKDIEHGRFERFKLYQDTWNACKTQIIKSARNFHTPVLEKLVAFIRESSSEYDNIHMLWMQKMLPRSEISVALVVGDDRQDLFDDLISHVANLTFVHISALSPANFSNIQTAMKAMIEGFIRNYDDKKRRPSASLGSHDMQLLSSWHNWLSSRENETPILTVLIQDVESCNAAVFQDLLSICRNYCDRLPLKFVLGTSTSDILTKTLSRIARTAIKVKTFHMPSQGDKFDILFREAFIQLSSSPGLILSGSIVHWLRRSWGAFNGTLDSLLSHLQLVYLRHFQHPITLLWTEPATLFESMLNGSRNEQEATLAAILGKSPSSFSGNKASSKKTLLDLVEEAFKQFQRSINTSRQALLVLLEVQRYLSSISPQSTGVELRISFMELLALFGDGKLESICGKLLQRVQLLTGAQLLELINKIQEKMVDIPSMEAGVESHISRLEDLREEIEDVDDQLQEARRTKHPLSETAASHLRNLWNPMAAWMASPLLRVWRTSETELPIDILNPSMRNTIISALSHPENYLLHDASQFIKVRPADKPAPSKRRGKGSPIKGKGKATAKDEVGYAENEEGAVVDPDISILFSRYANAGKTINVYDWFESFSQGLEAGRASRTKENGHGKGKKRGGKGGDDKDGEGEEGGDESWKREDYARFMWSLHEMDMLGLLRWSGRGTGKKGAECAGKTVWITPEE
ncbi:hypothetical protein FRC17_003747, partial [Serendipita sp. 399]